MARPARALHYTSPRNHVWLNAVEGFFAKLTKRRLERGVFVSIVNLQAADSWRRMGLPQACPAQLRNQCGPAPRPILMSSGPACLRARRSEALLCSPAAGLGCRARSGALSIR